MRAATYITLLLAAATFLLLGRWGSAQDAGPGDRVQELARARVAAAQKTYDLLGRNYRESRPPAGELLYRWSLRWLDAERDLDSSKSGQIAALRGHRNRMRELERVTKERFRERFVPIEEQTAAEFYRLEADLWLARAGG